MPHKTLPTAPEDVFQAIAKAAKASHARRLATETLEEQLGVIAAKVVQGVELEAKEVTDLYNWSYDPVCPIFILAHRLYESREFKGLISDNLFLRGQTSSKFKSILGDIVRHLCSREMDPHFKIMCQNLGLPENEIKQLAQHITNLERFVSRIEATGYFDDLDSTEPVQEELDAIKGILASLVRPEMEMDWGQPYASSLLRAVSDLSLNQFLSTGCLCYQ